MNTNREDIEKWSRRIRSRYPKESDRLTIQEMEESMAGWVSLLGPLELNEHEDQVRFLALCVLLDRQHQQSKLIQGVLKRVMSNFEWSPKRRLDFVYKHLVGRAVSASEEDFGPKFVPF